MWRCRSRRAPTTPSGDRIVSCPHFNFHEPQSDNSPQSETSNAMHNAASFPYNFSDFSANHDMTLQNEMKPTVHMDIPAGESNSIVILVYCWLHFMQIYHYHSLRNVTSAELSASSSSSSFFSGEVKVPKKKRSENVAEIKRFLKIQIRTSLTVRCELHRRCFLETTYQFSKRMKDDLTSS